MGINKGWLIVCICICSIGLTLPSSAQRNRKLFNQNSDNVLRFDDTLSNKTTQVSEPVEPAITAKDTAQKQDKPSKKELVISLVLPFNSAYAQSSLRSGNNSSNDTLDTKSSIPRETQIAIEFYKGAKLALSQYKGKSIKIQIFDDEKSESKLLTILENQDFAASDLVIGPVYNQNAKLMADYCKSHKILHFNPLSPAQGLAVSNPYHYKLFPSVSMHQKAVIMDLIQKHGGGKVYIFLKNTAEEKKSYSELYEFVTRLNAFNVSKVKINIDSLVVGNENAKKPFSELTSSEYHTYFFCISTSDATANEFARRLINHDALKCTGIGMPTWLDQDGIKLDYMNRAEMCFPMAVFADTTQTQTVDFIKLFKSTYRHEPNDNNLLGYDVMSLSLYTLSTFNDKLLQHFDEVNWKGAGINFSFEPVKISNAQHELNFDYFENKSIKILKLQDYQLISYE